MNASVELFRSEVRSHKEEFLKHVLTAACEQVHFGVQQHSFGDTCVERARREPCSNLEREWPNVRKSQSMRLASRSLSNIMALVWLCGTVSES